MSTNDAANSQHLQELEDENKELKSTIAGLQRFIRQTMGSYVTPEVANEILAQDGTIGIDGERRVVTMLFTDLRDSTALSEQMAASDYIRLLNHYFWEMIRIINSWQGNILDFVGDAIVVVFGAPKENPDSAHDALYSAVAMQRRMTAINEWNAEQGYPAIQMGIGVHTGEAIVGTIGSEVRMKYDMIGRNVNLASRIEGFSKGGQILASTQVVEAAGDCVVEREEGAMWVSPKGIAGDVLVHDVIGINQLRIPEWWD
ncbi:MAG: adenylate/guanylate cyclase domain-containing protein [Coriobacteriales bacterium]|nr:adenylate/guanylate cyclase domain-containing protein [Coriobacteriales bacterium]